MCTSAVAKIIWTNLSLFFSLNMGLKVKAKRLSNNAGAAFGAGLSGFIKLPLRKKKNQNPPSLDSWWAGTQPLLLIICDLYVHGTGLIKQPSDYKAESWILYPAHRALNSPSLISFIGCSAWRLVNHYRLGSLPKHPMHHCTHGQLCIIDAFYKLE